MSRSSTEDKIMQIRVKEDTYRRLLKIKGRLEEREGRLLSFDDALKELIVEAER